MSLLTLLTETMTLMIVPNLMVSDLGRSVAFYRKTLDMNVVFIVGPDREATNDPSSGVFSILQRDESQLMLQTRESLASELPVFASGDPSIPSTAVYFRGIDPDEVVPHIDKDQIEMGPFVQWYGMKEIHFRDPDGHMICAAIPTSTSDA